MNPKDCAWSVADLEDAMDQLRKAQVRDVPQRGARTLGLMPSWQASGLGELSAAELQGVCGLWCAGSDKRFPMPGQLLVLLAADRKSRRRGVEAAHGGQVPDSVKAESGEFRGWVDRVFGREWIQDGRRYREFVTASDFHGHSTEIPQRWQAMGYTVELRVPPNRCPDAVGLEWRAGFERDLTRFGAPRLKVQLKTERARAANDRPVGALS